MLYYSPPELLNKVIAKFPVSSQMAGMLVSIDLRTVVNALQMADILMQKLPEYFHVHFRREGVMHKIHELATASVEKVSCDKTNEQVQVIGAAGSEALKVSAANEEHDEQFHSYEGALNLAMSPR